MTDPVIMIPGLMCDARAFLPQVLHLGRDRLVTIALPILGSTVEAMAQAILGAAPAKFALVGMGLGGEVALEMLRRGGDRISRVALISTDPLSETPQHAASREARMVTARAGRLPQALAEEIPEGALADGPLRAKVRRQLIDMWHSLGTEVYLQQSRALQRRPDHQRTLRGMKVPALIIAGAQDTLTPVRRQEFAAGLMPFARVEVIAGAGHLPPMEAPEAVSKALEQFLQGPMQLQGALPKKEPPLLLR